MYYLIMLALDYHMHTTANIINLRTVKDMESWLQGENNDYIGRGTKILSGSKWGNPYKLCDNRDAVFSLYKQHITSDQKLVKAIPELKGKNLGC